MRTRHLARAVCALAAPLIIISAAAVQSGTASAATPAAAPLYVSPSGQPGHSGASCQSARFTSVQAAISAAPSGGSVIACAGSYHEQVVLTKPLALRGQGSVTISESGVTPAYSVTLPGLGPETIWAAVVIASSNVTVSGVTITGAVGEGVLAEGLGTELTGVTIAGDQVIGNDLGSIAGASYYLCALHAAVPGDCGEGVHFTGVANSTIEGSDISQNSGGVLLDDDTGPTRNVLVQGNLVTRNAYACGITLPGHNPGAVNAQGQPQPSVAGVYDNVVRANVVLDNGLTNDGGGVLIANAGASMAAYDNLVEDNYIAGNGLSGVVMHAHVIGAGQVQDLNGNVITRNVIARDNVEGDPLDGPAGPTDPQETGILVYSGTTPVQVTIEQNVISDNAIGIWLSKIVTAAGLPANTFSRVTTPVSASN
ncbi:MAG TPA: right-handed parallel beta-helix repeat-containing protein [Trebonia sp.]|nr:right-handed parallel beta-helix repeat-containing protein [Trebonia sp.]